MTLPGAGAVEANRAAQSEESTDSALGSVTLPQRELCSQKPQEDPCRFAKLS